MAQYHSFLQNSSNVVNYEEGVLVPQDVNHPEWITYGEAQRLTSLGRTTLWRICSAEDSGIEVAHVGRAVRINRANLMAYMKRSAGGGNQKLNDAKA